MSDNQGSRITARLEAVRTEIQNLNMARARHSQRIKHLEEDNKLAHVRISAVKKLVIGGLITIATIAVKHAWSLLESATKNQ